MTTHTVLEPSPTHISAEKLRAIFQPRSVALVGASGDPGHLGRQILENLLAFQFAGRVYPVNPRLSEVAGLPCYASIAEVPECPDLAVLVVSRSAVSHVLEDCIARGVRGLVIITAGFRELNAEGAKLEAELSARAKQAGLPLVGPNCMGLFNADPAVRLNLTFAPAAPRAGHVAFLSQSGALGAAMLSLAPSRGLGFSIFASLGNEAGVTHRDALEFAAQDQNTHVIALYLETFDNPSEFLRLTRQITRIKPVVCLKGGRTESGARAARSHTGALATSSRTFEAVMKQSGVALVRTLEELLDVAPALAHSPAPCGRRVRLLTNAGGPGVLAADALARHGFSLPPLGTNRQSQLRAVATPQAVLGNPVDLTVEGTAAAMGASARILLEDEETDALAAIFVAPPRVPAPGVIAELESIAGDSAKPIVAAIPAQDELVQQHSGGKLALVRWPEGIAPVLGALARVAEAKSRPPFAITEIPANRTGAAEIIRRSIERGQKALDVQESLALAACYGIPVVRQALVRDREELREAANTLGFPMAMKAVSSDVLHKTERGAVALKLENLEQVEKAYDFMHMWMAADGLRGVLLQEMVEGGRELILGFYRDEQQTPLLLLGLGGVQAEALEAVTVRACPVTKQDLQEMLEELPGKRLLGAFRGMRPVNQEAVVDALARLAQLGRDFPNIREIDINPFLAFDDAAKCRAVDARVLLDATAQS